MSSELEAARTILRRIIRRETNARSMTAHLTARDANSVLRWLDSHEGKGGAADLEKAAKVIDGAAEYLAGSYGAHVRAAAERIRAHVCGVAPRGGESADRVDLVRFIEMLEFETREPVTDPDRTAEIVHGYLVAKLEDMAASAPTEPQGEPECEATYEESLKALFHELENDICLLRNKTDSPEKRKALGVAMSQQQQTLESLCKVLAASQPTEGGQDV